MMESMFRAAVVLTVASVLLTALALINCLSEEDRGRIRALPRWAWLLLILFVPVLGALAYFVAGRPVPVGGQRQGWLSGGGAATEPPRPRAPDDDPDFLRSLGQHPPTDQDEDLLRRWEEDLKRREEERRRRDRDA
jgi:hypothetical protein